MVKSRVLIAMSGGVDSSVATALLLRQGYECSGITMQLSGNDDAVEAARDICSQLRIPHYYLDLQDTFEQRVVEPFVRGYAEGTTPNPCIACNRHLKFGFLYDWASQEGFDYLATGHYARLENNRLCKAADKEKDQSYVLYTLTTEQLSSLLFPLGEYTKEEIRQLAAELSLANAYIPESQDICFIPEGDYAGFIESFLKKRDPGRIPLSGNIVTLNGTVVGRHEGIHHFTIGQRRGLGVAGAEPYYVVDIDSDSATVFIGTKNEQGRKTALISEVNLLEEGSLWDGRAVSAKHRYRGGEHKAEVYRQGDNAFRIIFSEKQTGLTNGQALVLYDRDCVLGGGTIVDTSSECGEVNWM